MTERLTRMVALVVVQNARPSFLWPTPPDRLPPGSRLAGSGGTPSPGMEVELPASKSTPLLNCGLFLVFADASAGMCSPWNLSGSGRSSLLGGCGAGGWEVSGEREVPRCAGGRWRW
jgi:hypothetical protein